MPWFETRALRKEFQTGGKTVAALDSISLVAERGDFVGIVGRSGSGKTTFLRIAAGLLEATDGNILFNGSVCGDDARPKIGMVFQEPRLMPWLTLEQNILFAFLNEPQRSIPYRRALEIMEMLGLSDFRDAYPHQLSGGMAQRTALGRALCYDPELILMDEPLGSLDYFTRKSLQSEIIKLYLSGGKTIFFVTHDVDEALLLSRRIAVLEGGKIKTELDIDLEYPRSRTNPKFTELLDRILGEIDEKEHSQN